MAQETEQPAPTTEAPAEAPSAESVLRFDPFAQRAEAPSEPTAPVEPPAPAPAADGSVAQPPAQPAPMDPVVQSLAQTQAQLTAVMERQQRQSASAEEPAPRFSAQVNPELIAAIRSEDPMEAQAAVSSLVNGVANLAYEAAVSDVQVFMQQHIPALVSRMLGEERIRQQVESDFYATYPTLDRPELKAVVMGVGQKVVAEFAAQGKPLAWGSELRDTIAQRTMALIGAAVPVQPAPVAPVRQPYQASSSARPTPAPQNDVVSTLFG